MCCCFDEQVCFEHLIFAKFLAACMDGKSRFRLKESDLWLKFDGKDLS